jgi:hypothetical protein
MYVVTMWRSDVYSGTVLNVCGDCGDLMYTVGQCWNSVLSIYRPRNLRF